MSAAKAALEVSSPRANQGSDGASLPRDVRDAKTLPAVTPLQAVWSLRSRRNTGRTRRNRVTTRPNKKKTRRNKIRTPPNKGRTRCNRVRTRPNEEKAHRNKIRTPSNRGRTRRDKGRRHNKVTDDDGLMTPGCEPVVILQSNDVCQDVVRNLIPEKRTATDEHR